MKRATIFTVTILAVFGLAIKAQTEVEARREEIQRHRNLGKAFYENPTTQALAVEEFRKALDLAPQSTVERVNYGLALLRAGRTEDGVRELEKAREQDPNLPHTWFNLGITAKKNSEYERAIPLLEGMLRLVPDEAVTHYNLGVLYKLGGKQELAQQHFEASTRLSPNLAGPHFQLYNAYRQAGRAEDATREQTRFQEIKKQTAGAAIPEDLEWSFYSEIYDPIEPVKGDSGAPVAIVLTPETLGSGVDTASAGLTVADIDGDGRLDLIAWSDKGVQVFLKGSPGAVRCGLENLKGVLHIASGDFNNDGLPDLAVITKDGPMLYENRKGAFVPSAIKLPAGHYSRAVWVDFDHDYDLDLILLGQDAALARNNGGAGFSDETARFPFAKATALDAAVLDLVPDTPALDLVVTYADRKPVLYVDHLAGKYVPQTLDAAPSGASAIAAFDFNGDSFTDLAVTTADGITLLRNRDGRFEPAATLKAGGRASFADLANSGKFDLAASGGLYTNRGQDRFDPASNAALSGSVVSLAAELDGDLREDIAVVMRDGSVQLLHNRTEAANHGLTVSLTGVKNLKTAVGAKVEVKAGSHYQKQTYTGRPLHFGTGAGSAVDTLRITWANGMVQNEVKQSAGKALAVKEAPRLSGSCPMIFTWNGSGFEYITDVLGVAPLGASSGDGEYFPVDHDEYIQIRPGALVPRGGEYEVRITEELHEVSYLDQVRLIAVDHPAAEEVFTNDKFKAPPFPEFRLFGVKRRIYPIAARDERGADVRPQLLAIDQRYPNTLTRGFDGAAELHRLDLDFGRAAASNRAVLILNGWVDWADGSTFLAATQEKPGGLAMPYVQVKDQRGAWQTVISDMGMPSGKPKTIAVDLTGKFLSASRQVRIVTSLCVYWDEVFLSEDGDAEAVITPLDATSADLHFRGFSQPVIDADRKQPERFLYERVSPTSQWNPTPGLYTRYGDVTGLARGLDDLLVIMGAGDELTLKFRPGSLPPLRPAWQRDFLLLVDGWAKDSDPNTAFSRTVEPLPFHAMSAYPYPDRERFPEDRAHREYRTNYNTRPALRLLRSLTTD